MSLDVDIDKLLVEQYETAYDAGYSSGFNEGLMEGQSYVNDEYDRGYDSGVQEGYTEGCSETKAETENLVAVIRDIENDMHWTLQDGTADDHTAIVAHVKKWQDRIRTELEDAPL